MTTNNDEREAFEAWCRQEGINPDKCARTRVYSYPSARVGWRAWQAARQPAARVGWRAWQAARQPAAPSIERGADAGIPEYCDVRKILLRVVPGNGSGHEIYARSVSDVEALLSEMGERLENIEARSARQPAASLESELRQLSNVAEEKRKNADNPNIERIWLGMRDAYDIAANMVAKCARQPAAAKLTPHDAGIERALDADEQPVADPTGSRAAYEAIHSEGDDPWVVWQNAVAWERLRAKPAAATLSQIAGDLWNASINCDFDAFKAEVERAKPAAATGQEPAKVGEIVRTVSGHITVIGNELWIFTEKYVDCDLYAVPKGSSAAPIGDNRVGVEGGGARSSALTAVIEALKSEREIVTGSMSTYNSEEYSDRLDAKEDAINDCIARVEHMLAAPHPSKTDERNSNDRALTETIKQRDHFEEIGTRLAEKVGEYLGVDVGEWSSANDPILAAIEALDDAVPHPSQPAESNLPPETRGLLKSLLERYFNAQTAAAILARVDQPAESKRAGMTPADINLIFISHCVAYPAHGNGMLSVMFFEQFRKAIEELLARTASDKEGADK